MGIAVVTGVLCILSFTIGAIIGQKVVKQEPIKIPTPKIESFEEKRERRLEAERNDIILANIDNYNGTGLGQQKLPE